MTTKKSSDPAGDVAEQVAKANDQGFIGQKVDPRPNEAYTLETGPDSPPAVEDDASRSVQHTSEV